MAHLFKNLFTSDQIEVFYDEVREKDLPFFEVNTTYISNGLGRLSDDYQTLDFFRLKIEQKLREVYNFNFKYSHSFSSIYRNRSVLNLHVDRLSLDITASLCAIKGTKTPFPLFVSTKLLEEDPVLLLRDNPNYFYDNTSYFKQDYQSFELLNGDVAVCLGTKEPHWREMLVCDEKEYNFYVFFHWTRV